MRSRFTVILGAAFVLLGLSTSAHAADTLKAVASFSILGDMVKNVGGERVEVTTLVGPNGDAHVFSPTPADAKTLAEADIFFVNGLGFEGWMQRLETSSGFEGTTVVASKGVTPLEMVGGHHHGGEADEDHHEAHEDHAKGEEDHDHGDHAAADENGDEETDPHAWQSLANGEIYVANIRDGLIAADPEGKEIYEANAKEYLAALKNEDTAVKAAIANLPKARRRFITSHDAFGYFAKAYGIEVISPEGVSTESEASAQDVAKIIRQIREEKIPAVFIENITDRRLLDQIARETGAKIGGVLYSDALSDKDGPAPTYLDMFRHNVGALTAALSS
jgi:zinc/manganese transport system substrate-binding protein